MKLENRVRALLSEGLLDLPLPGSGCTAARLKELATFAREDVSLGRLVEAHTDAIAILREAGRQPVEGALYGVWAAEVPDHSLRLDSHSRVYGSKGFCSGANIVDRALVTVRFPEEVLIEVDLRRNSDSIRFRDADWIATAFTQTNTATVQFHGTRVSGGDIIGDSGWYLTRPGFWHGACGPASCWAGGAMGLVDYARLHPSTNPHNLAHMGAMEADVWAMDSCMEVAGNEIDETVADLEGALIRALKYRHIVEHLCSDILDRFGRSYGPGPLAFDAEVSRRFQEVHLYLRQCHSERDLEALGRHLSKPIAGARTPSLAVH